MTDIQSAAGETKPTPRAISERLVKIRKDVKSAGTAGANFTVAKGNGSAATTPVKQRPSKSMPGPKTPTSAKRNRRQGSASKKESPEAEAEAEDDVGNYGDMDIDTPSKKPTSVVQVVVKKEPGERSASADANASPPKRARKPAVRSHMVGYTSDNEGQEEVDGQGETSASEFMPDDSFDSGAVKMET